MPSADDDYIERARTVWQRYQFYIYVGLAMILATITGFTFSHSAFDDNRRTANEHLYQLLDSTDNHQHAEARSAYEVLQQSDGFPELHNLAAFALSSLHFTAGEYQQVAALLQPVLDSSSDAGIRQLAALRLAEAQIAAGEYQQAVELLWENMPAEGRLQVMFEERIGDAEYTAGNVAAAKEAYERALALAVRGAAFYRPLLNIKRGALLSTPEAARLNADAEAAN